MKILIPSKLLYFLKSTLKLLIFSSAFFALVSYSDYAQVEAVQLPDNHRFFQKANSEKLIVFVHGLNGDPVETWTYKKSAPPFYWPEHLAKSDSAFLKSDVYSFGYKSECGPTFNIREIAKSLETRINQLLSERKYRTLSFVAHSMGGLVVREFILSRHKHLISKTPIESVVLLSTPNTGSGLAKYGKYFCNNIQMKDLQPGRENYIDTLNDRWRERFRQQEKAEPFHFSSGYELVPTSFAGLIVEKDSAVSFSRHTHAFIKNHSKIAKPIGVNDELYIWVKQRLLKKPPDLRMKSRNEKVKKNATEIIPKLQEELKGTDMENALDLISSGELDNALKLLSKYEEKEKEQVEKIAKTRFAKAQIYELKIDYRKAIEYYEKAVQLAPENRLYLNDAGVMLDKLGEYDRAIQYYKKALELDIKTFGTEHPKVATLWNNLGEAWRAKGKYDKAIEYYEKALKSDIKTLGIEHPSVAIRWNNLGAAWFSKGEYDKAIEYYEKALKSDIKTLGIEHPSVAIRWNNLGEAWRAKGKYDKAIEYYEKALESDIKTFGTEHPQVAIYWNNMGLAWKAKGEYDKAIEYFEKALKSDINTFGTEHPSVARDWNNLGAAWDSKGEYDKAIQYYEKVLKVFLNTFGTEHPKVAVSWNNLGGAWKAKGEYDKAIEYYEKALESDIKTFGTEHPDVAIDWNNLGLAWYSKGEYEKAREALGKALNIFKKFRLNHRVKLVEGNLEEMESRELGAER